MNLYCHVTVTQPRPISETSAPKFRTLPLQAMYRTRANCKLKFPWHHNSEPGSCAVLVSYRKIKLSLQELSHLSCWLQFSRIFDSYFQVVENFHFVPPAETHEHRGMSNTETAHQLYLYFHLSSNRVPAVERNQDILTSGSEVTGYKGRMGILTGAREHGNCFDQGIKCFCEIFWHEADNRLYSFNLKHDLTVGINCKINLTTYFACAQPQHGGGERAIVRINATQLWILFQGINWNCATSLSILVIIVNFSVTATCVFYLSWPLSWTSPWTFNCRNSDHKIADLEHVK